MLRGAQPPSAWADRKTLLARDGENIILLNVMDFMGADIGRVFAAFIKEKLWKGYNL